MKRYALLALIPVLACTLFAGCRRMEADMGMTTPSTADTRPTTEPTVPMTTEPATQDTTERPTDSPTEPTDAAEPTGEEDTRPTARGVIQDPALR